METTRKSYPIYRGFLLFLSLIFILAVIDYRYFVSKSESIEVLDGLNARLSSTRVSIVKLEYMLDMFVVNRRFEGTTVDLIKSDMEKVDEAVSGIVENPSYRDFLRANTLISEGLASMAEDWQTIKYEITRLHGAISQDEVMLIHNAVDMHTIVINEKADRLLSVINEKRASVFGEFRALALESIVGFILICLAGAMVFYRRVVSPATMGRAVAGRFASGEKGARFPATAGGALGGLFSELNALLDKAVRLSDDKDRRALELSERLVKKNALIEALNSISAYAGRSISPPEIFSAAVKEAATASGADGTAIYVSGGAGLILRASYGFDDILPNETGLPAGPSEPARVYGAVDEYPDRAISGPLRDKGFSLLVYVPLYYNGKLTGALFATYRDPSKFISGSLPFFKSVASIAGSFSGHLGLLHDEHSLRRFLDRVVQQLPLGAAVFGRDGVCLMANAALRKLLGVDHQSRLVGSYRIFDDGVLSSVGVLQSIIKSYEGYMTEFAVNYNPALLSGLGLTGSPRRLKIRSMPLYDAGGEVSEILLLYEEVTDATGTPAGPGEAV